ncbi:MAG: peptidylprolyl isomerase [Prevotellaceae bacterium]|nr:peptidylprolyl isomerase [Prevotellaceae bacterium]
MIRLRYAVFALLIGFCFVARAQNDNVLDEVVWIVGDEPILKSDIEMQRLAAEYNRTTIDGDPYVVIPEELAIQKLFLHQAALDSIEVSEADVQSFVDNEVQRQINIAGSERNLENYRNMTMKEIRAQVTKMIIDQYKMTRVRDKIIGDYTATPAEVRRYFKNIPQDSLPTIPTQVEIQIINETPFVTPDEVQRVKAELMEYAERVNKGESFAMLARMYSRDGSAVNGGELGFKGRAEFVPEFSSVAFSLTDPKTVSKIVKTEYGYHIIQLIERRGDKINCRHILRTPEISAEETRKTLARLDSIANLVRTDKMTFEQAVYFYSDDKETRNNHGLMAYTSPEDGTLTSRIRMDELHRNYQDVAIVVEQMHVGEISDAFVMRGRNGMNTGAIIKLKNRIPEHKADITDDFQVLTDIVNEKRSEEIVQKWIEEKIKSTYIRIKDDWKRSGYKYNWLKQ